VIRNQAKILLLLSFALIAFAYFIWQVYATNNRLRQTRETLNRTYLITQNIKDLHSDLTASESALRAYALTKDSLFVEQVYRLSDQVLDRMVTTEQLILDSAVRQEMTELKKLMNQKMNFQFDVISSAAQSPGQPVQEVASLKGKRLMDSIQALVDRMQARQNELLNIRNEQNTAVSRTALLTAIIGSLIFFIFIALILWRLSLDMRRRIYAERELQQFRFRFQAILDNTPLLIFLKDLEGRYILVNKSFRETFGFREEQLIGKTDYDFEEKADAEKYKRSDDAVIRTLKPVEQDEVLPTSNGKRLFHYIKFPVLDEGGKIFAISGFGSDVTERKVAEGKLRTSEEKMRALLDSTKEGFFMLDKDFNVLLMNEAGKNMMQLITGKLIDIGENVFKIVFPEERQMVRDNMQKVLGGESVETEQGYMTAEGQKWFLINYQPIKNRDSEEKPPGICIVCRDITDLIRYREKLIEAKKKAERAEKLQEQFLANMSHEIRTPLNGITGMTNLLLNTQLTEAQHEYVNIIKYSSDNLSVLINDILDFSKIKAGKLSIENIEFTLWEVAQKAVASLQTKAKEKDLGVLIFFHPNMPQRIKGDPHRLNQVLNNLLSNAIKFTQQGYVRLEIAVSRETDDICWLQFNVKDSGIGIPEDKLAVIFESFSQASEDITRKYGGTGLGLTITKQLIELQHGTIDITSEPGAGTTISFEIPYQKVKGLSNKQETTEEEEITNRNATLANKQILIVEDNEVNQKVIAYNLEPAGIITTIVNNGREAVDMLEGGKHFDLVIMDLQMPVMNGFQATAYIRQKLNSRIPIIAMTASALRNEQVKCFELGMNEYVTKPFSPSELMRVLEKHLNGENGEASMPQGPQDKQPYNLDNISIKKKKDVIAHVLNIFLRDTPPLLQEIKNHILHEHWDETYQKAHKLKSSVGLLQMHDMLQTITLIEQYAKNRDQLDELPGLIDAAMEDYNLVQPMLEAERTSATATA
jgi:PAS domain S-box-containing protein